MRVKNILGYALLFALIVIQPTKADINEDRRKYAVTLATPKCTGDILVEMDNIKLKMTRNASFFREPIDHLIEIDIRHPLYDCSIKSLLGVKRITIKDQLDHDHGMLIHAPLTDNLIKVRAPILIKEIETLRQKGNSSILPSGLEVIEAEYKTFYVFPQSIAPTPDGVPVTYACTRLRENQKHFKNHECMGSYTHPSGLVVSYMFYRRDFSVDKYLELEKQKRKMISDMIQSPPL